MSSHPIEQDDFTGGWPSEYTSRVDRLTMLADAYLDEKKEKPMVVKMMAGEIDIPKAHSIKIESYRDGQREIKIETKEGNVTINVSPIGDACPITIE